MATFHPRSRNYPKYLYWSPRIICLAIIGLFAILSLDVFSSGSTGSDVFISLVIHLIPAFILAIALFYGWRNELYGAMIFNILAILSLFIFDTVGSVIGFLLITLPFLIIGELFFLLWYLQSSDFRS